MNKKKRILKYSEYVKMITDLYIQLRDGSKSYTMLVGVGRGGLVPAVYLSHMTGIPMRSLDYSLSDISRHIPRWFTEAEDVLVVDDIADSGRTLIELSAANPKADFATLIHKPHTSRFNPNYTAEVFTEDAWITFPWEEE